MKRIVSLLLCLFLACSAAGAFADELVNPYITTHCEMYIHFMLSAAESLNDMEFLDNFAFTAGKILYNRRDTRIGYTGQRVADGGAMNDLGTCTIGCGAGVDNEELWYVTNTFSAGMEPHVLSTSALAMFLSAWPMCPAMGADADEAYENAGALADLLLSCNVSTAYQIGNLVFFCKPLDGRAPLNGGMFILGVNSLDFYNEFYYGTIPNYIVLD